MNVFTNFSILPLQCVTFLGCLSSLLGFAGGAWYVVLFLSQSIAVPGYASTIIAILILGGVQLMSLGIIGEYLGRLHLNVNRKPQYRERQVLGSAVADRVVSTRTEVAPPDVIDRFDKRVGRVIESEEISNR